QLAHLEELDLGRGAIGFDSVQQSSDRLGRLLAERTGWNAAPWVDGRVLGALAPLRSLRVLRLAGGAFAPADLAALANFPALEELELDRTDLAADAVEKLPTSLRRLHIANCARVDDEFARRLAVHCPGLTALDASNTAVGDAGLQALLAMRDLADVRLANTRLTGASLAPLLAHPRFRPLDLGSMPWPYEHQPGGPPDTLAALFRHCDHLLVGSLGAPPAQNQRR